MHIKDQNGKLLFNEEVIAKTCSPTHTEGNKGEDILLDEITKAIEEMKTGKASGHDHLATEMLKALDEEGLRKGHNLINKIYKTGYIPPKVKESIFICLPKKPKATKYTMYWTLSLMSHLLKMLLQIILLRNRKRV